MAQSRTPNRLGGEIGVGDLEGHANREGEISEVPVIGSIGLVEVNSAWFILIVEARVVEREDGVHAEPTKHDADQSDCQEVRLRRTVSTSCSHQGEGDGRQNRDSGYDHEEIGYAPTRVKSSSSTLRGLGFQMPNGQPCNKQEDACRDVPADKRGSLSQGEERGNNAAYHSEKCSEGDLGR